MNLKNKTYSVVKLYLSLQGIFFIRLLKEMALHHIIVLLLLYIVAFFVFSSISPYFSLLAYGVFILYYNWKKKDREFLKIQFGNDYKICYFLLYTILSLPFLIISVVSANWMIVFFYPMIAAFIAFLLQANKIVDLRISNPLLTEDAYEYVSGFRAISIFYIALFVFSFMGAYAGNMRIPKILSCIAIYIFAMSYFLEYREEYLLNYSCVIDVFKKKVKDVIVNNVVCLIPFFLLIFCFEHTCRSLYLCILLYVISVLSMINILTFRILFERQEFFTFFMITTFYAIALFSVMYPIVLFLHLIVTFVLLVPAYNKVKIITRK